MKIKTIAAILISSSLSLFANDLDTSAVSETLTQEQAQAMVSNYVDSVNNSFDYQTGEITINGDLATINIPSGFKFLNGEDSETVLTTLWGNPPSEASDKSLGMIVPDDFNPFKDSTFSINITYSEEGFVEDDDAADIDYDDLLEELQTEAQEANKERVKLGYGTVEIVGWAASPYYDQANKKLHWAKEIKFDDSEVNTLNYNIRILGRKGYLQLNAIGGMNVLDMVNANIDPIIRSVDFNPGNQYADFDSNIDEVAAYGIGGLIAGKALLKAGLLAKFGVLLAKFWKVIVFGVIGIGAVFKKFFTKSSKE